MISPGQPNDWSLVSVCIAYLKQLPGWPGSLVPSRGECLLSKALHANRYSGVHYFYAAFSCNTNRATQLGFIFALFACMLSYNIQNY